MQAKKSRQRDLSELHARGARLIVRWGRIWKLKKLARQVEVVWSPRLKRSLGKAYPQRKQVRLNLLLGQPEWRLHFDEVLCHEVAHVAVFMLVGKVPAHGTEWTKLVRLAGFKPRIGIVEEKRSGNPAVGLVFEHRCPVCNAARMSRRPQRSWRCVSCGAAGLDGELVIRSLKSNEGPND